MTQTPLTDYDALVERLRYQKPIDADNVHEVFEVMHEAADAIRDLRLQSKRITLCQDCGAAWYDDGNNGVACPYCQITALRAERDALAKALRGCRDDLAWMHDYDGQMNQKCCLERIAVIDAALAAQERKL